MWFKHSLKGKLSLLLIVAIVFPLLGAGVVSYRIASNLTEKIEKQSGMNTLRQLSDKLDFIINDIETMSVFIIGQRNIQSYLGSDRADISLYSQNVAFLLNLASSKPYISNITITSGRGYPALSNTTVLHSGLPRLLEANTADYNPAQKWWTPLYENQTTDDGIKRVFSLVRPIRSTEKFQPLGELAISVDVDEVQEMLQDAAWNANGRLWLVNQEDRIMSSQTGEGLNMPLGQSLQGLGELRGTEGVLNIARGQESNTLLYYTLPSLNWKLVGVIPTRIYTAQNEYVLTLTAVAIGVAALLAGALVLYFTAWVTRPLTKLARKLKDVSPGDPVKQFEVRSTDEIGMVLHSYNQLGERIERLKNQLQLNEAKKKEADIQALQAQIHPHFLYNTLSSIHWIALMNKDRQVAEMVGALGDFLRFSLNDGKEFCSVGQEVAHAQNYVRIMSKRFQDKFDSTFLIDPKIQERTMLKLLLQPLIENSIMHGLKKKQGKGSVFVHAELRGDGLSFVVEDTGVGMDEEKLLHLRSLLLAGEADEQRQSGSSNSGYGLSSVDRRLKLHYGSGAGLHIESQPGGGTRISFTIPVLEG
ncbi:two-component system, sensor histidine kinase YesM [Paenibacillus sophorae]|uniref:histidine kinase n=1 Tax=Paenibacillus sophorae TaxID=1333845 RepID=A0A1H8P5V3_9BACL|nr:sensor histidine kinase [Paenibacillus sophorae]QWU16452.1 sensor histidine kinase [Paenibacillus sophorae]SEO37320.1 two-component system, sensor histidine kinase YesM [Paenibacillus sophorae]